MQHVSVPTAIRENSPILPVLVRAFDLTHWKSHPEGLFAIIPAYNEHLTIGSVVILARHYVNKVIVVNDSSSDDTAQVALGAGAEVIMMDSNGGKANAIFLGLAQAR
jgi:cellulose synthase/poly-beta-1,6-N-acetylglucosamine synthase-like glycosyltransferase